MDDSKPAESKAAKQPAEPGIGLSRIRKIMRSTADTGQINAEGLFAVARATKLFIEYLAKGSQKYAKSDEITYDHLAKLVSDSEKLEFLLPIIPCKITVKEFKQILTKESDDDSSDDDENRSSEEEDGGNQSKDSNAKKEKAVL